MNQSPEGHPKPQQTHTPEGPPEEYINDHNGRIEPPPGPKQLAAPKPGVLTTLGKILSFLHR